MLLKGGQGRSARDVESSAWAWAAAVVAAIVLVLAALLALQG